jgi:hypothetical protein
LEGLADAFTAAERNRWPQSFPEHSLVLGIYGLNGGKRIYDIKFFEAQGLVSSYGKYHTGPVFSRQVSTLDEAWEAIVEARAAMAEAFPAEDVIHRESYFSRVTLWSGAKSMASAMKPPTKPKPGPELKPEPEPEPEPDVPMVDLFGGDDDDDW